MAYLVKTSGTFLVVKLGWFAAVWYTRMRNNSNKIFVKGSQRSVVKIRV